MVFKPFGMQNQHESTMTAALFSAGGGNTDESTDALLRQDERSITPRPPVQSIAFECIAFSRIERLYASVGYDR